MYLVYSWPPST